MQKPKKYQTNDKVCLSFSNLLCLVTGKEKGRGVGGGKDRVPEACSFQPIKLISIKLGTRLVYHQKNWRVCLN